MTTRSRSYLDTGDNYEGVRILFYTTTHFGTRRASAGRRQRLPPTAVAVAAVAVAAAAVALQAHVADPQALTVDRPAAPPLRKASAAASRPHVAPVAEARPLVQAARPALRARRMLIFSSSSPTVVRATGRRSLV